MMATIAKSLRSTDGTQKATKTPQPEAAVTGKQGGLPPRAGKEAGAPGSSWLSLLIWTVVAAGSFQAAYLTGRASFLMLFYLFGLVQLTRAATWRSAWYSGLTVGLLIAATQLEFFWRIFSAGAIALWLVYSVWIALFVVLARLCLRRLRAPWNWVLLPFLWCGLEYFRSELYYLRFSWLSPGFAFATLPGQVPLNHLGTYGLGFLLMGLVCVAAFRWHQSPIQTLAGLALGMGVLSLWGMFNRPATGSPPSKPLHIAGVQMEFPTEPEVLTRLNDLVRKHPETELIVLSEYTFSDPVPDRIKRWCRDHQRHLIVGAKEPTPDGNFYNTAFVISPAGEIVFRQVKSVPIQFFKDGLPALEQKLWDSPWGKLGLCICYDLSYSRVTDRLVGLGAQALIVPTMDVADWGERQHRLHARVAPLRAAEYGLPIFRLASSGISQAVDRSGQVLATAPYPGDGAVLLKTLQVGPPGRQPLDRWLAPCCSGVTLVTALGLLAGWLLRLKHPALSNTVAEPSAVQSPNGGLGEAALPVQTPNGGLGEAALPK